MSNIKFNKGVDVLLQSKAHQWCYVNTDNEFIFMNELFIIDDGVKEYEVHNKASEVYDFTNLAYMEKVLVVLYTDESLKFYNQDFDLIENKYITVKK